MLLRLATLLILGLPAIRADAQLPVPELLAELAGGAAYAPPALDPAELADLAAGEAVVKVAAEPTGEDDEISTMAVWGLKLVDAPRLLLWLSVMGGNDERDYRLTPAMLSRGPDGAYVRYQHVDLPWPVRDRHWVIDCEKNTELAAATNGRAWQHVWALHEEGPSLLDAAFADGRIPGLTRDDLDDSVYLPANSGAWTMIDAGGNRTLIVASLDADLGGHFPDVIVRAFTKRKLASGMRTLVEMATRVHVNYDQAPVIHDGYGRPIAATEARRVASLWQDRRQLADAR